MLGAVNETGEVVYVVDASDGDPAGEQSRDPNSAPPKRLVKLLGVLVPVAMQALRKGFGLIELHHGDEAQAEAALWSAASSFQRHFPEVEFEEIHDIDELAGHLARIAYNRWQRRDRRQKKITRAAALGESQLFNQESTIQNLADPSPTPSEDVEAKEVSENLWAAVDQAIRELGERERRTVTAWVNELYAERKSTFKRLGDQLGVSQPSVSRHVSKFLERLRELLEEDASANE